MNKLLITGCLLATAIAAVAMPTKKELAAAQKLVEDVIAPDVKALNAGRKTVKDVADIQMKLAADAQSEAERYLLLQSAFKLYSRGEEFDFAAKALTAITRDIKDVPPELITELVDREFNRDMGLKAPKEIEAAVNRIADGGPKVFDAKATVDGYTWSYRVSNGEAEIVAEKDGKFSCAVSPVPTGNVVIPETLGGMAVTRIGQCAFKDSKGMTSVKIPSSVKSFGAWGVFAGCSGLTSVTIPNGVKSIEECAFWGCSNLKSVTIPPSVTKISDAAFGCCGGLTSMTIPPAVRELRTQVFFGCGALKSVTIPASVEKIGWAAFVYSGKLKEINVDPENKWFTSVGGALYTKDLTELVACPNALTSLTIHPSVKKLRDAAIISCGKLESLTIPEGVTDIGWQAIKDCASLKSVMIPSTVKSIAEIAFCNCRSLTSVTIPESVSSIGKRAFENCGALTSVTMRGERPNSSGDIFPKCANLKSIHVPANAKSWAGMKEWQGISLVFDAR